MEQAAFAGCRSASLAAVVTRCGCGSPHLHRGSACQYPLATEDLGVISYWHRNPVRRFLWRMTRAFKGR